MVKPWPLLAALNLFVSPILAHQEDSVEPERRPRSANYDLEKLRTKRYGAFEFRIAPYFPAVDKEFSGATPYNDAFGKKPAWALGIEGDWQIFHIPHLGSIGPALAWHYLTRKGTADFTDPNTEGESEHPQRFWMMPMYAVAVFRLDVLKQDFSIPIVPYAKFGFAAYLWQGLDANKISKAGDLKAKGLEYGWTGHLGLMLHLNPLSPQSAADMDASTGVNDAYLFAEWWYSDVSSFGNGMHVGSSTISAGITVEY
jgi:hypothetical protein